ncbi:MAG: AIR synthase-related protein, partial [Gemmatimonadaceae bacterium]
DISDGLLADLAHVAAASKVRVQIELGRIPRIEGVAPLEAANSGEEYEVVVTAPSIDTEEFSAEFGLALTEIGRVVAGPVGVELVERGDKVSVPPGFDHFRNR